MKRHIIVLWILSIFIYITLHSITVHAWGDNGGGRPDYTIEEIDNGAIGATENSDGENYKESENYPGTIVFNSISDSVIGHEKNFVGARECFQGTDGTWVGATKDTIWNADEIEVSDEQVYIIRAYVHNNNPNGEDAVAEDTRVKFIVPADSAKEVEVNGIINSSNAIPSKYWDHVTFKSSNRFHLEYIENTALLENNGIGKGGIQLSDDILKDGGTLIGYDKLDGRIPGCYQYDGFVTIKVRAVFDYDYTVETKVRHVGDTEWQDTITANIGDKVEFQIHYSNTSKFDQLGVSMRDVLPQSLRYVPGSTKIKNSNFPNGGNVESDVLVGENGLAIGDAGPDSGTIVMFTAEVIEEGLGRGTNTLVNWGNASVGYNVVKDCARVIVYNDVIFRIISSILITLIVICLIIIIFLFCRMQHLKHLSSRTRDKD